LILTLLALVHLILADTRTVDFAKRKAERVQSQRVEKQIWTRPAGSDFQRKTFPIEAWQKHYSPLGVRRAPIAVDEKRQKDRFEAKVLDRKTVPLEVSRWSEQMAELHRRAGIQMDEQARIAADRKLYSMMMQDARQYGELAERLSLRELNQFQFRRNRPDGEIPAQTAGGGE
jgi:hypothetical protein